MPLSELVSPGAANTNLETLITRKNNTLVIPEGLATIPCTHGIHRFAGKFIPNLPRYLLRELMPPMRTRVILDPFCGSGTTLVEAALEGKPFIGMDIDPLSVFISSAKTQLLSNNQLSTLEKFWAQHDFSKGHPEVIPAVPNINHWFTDKTLDELSSIKFRCKTLPPKLKLFSLVVFSSILRRVSNADDQTQKTYVSHTLPKTPPSPSVLFPRFLNRAIKGMREYASRLPTSPNGIVRQGDAANDIAALEFDDVITSPPYIDSIDYVYNQMLEYFWLLDELGIYSHKNYLAMRKQPMGFRTCTKNIATIFLKKYLTGAEESFETICSKIGEANPKEELTVRSFFFDYARHIEQVSAKQRKNGTYACIVGNSLIRGITVPTDDLVTRIHINAGYKLVAKYTYEIRRHYMKFPRRNNSGKIKQDYVLIFKA